MAAAEEKGCDSGRSWKSSSRSRRIKGKEVELGGILLVVVVLLLLLLLLLLVIVEGSDVANECQGKKSREHGAHNIVWLALSTSSALPPPAPPPFKSCSIGAY